MAKVQPASCSCGAKIWMAPTPTGGTMPVDIDRDPDGNLVAVRIPGKGWGVKVMTESEMAASTPMPRYRPHWATCPHPDQYRTRAKSQAPTTWPARPTPAARGPGARSGPCPSCGTVYPNRYGPDGQPLCPACRGKSGLPPVSSLPASQ